MSKRRLAIAGQPLASEGLIPAEREKIARRSIAIFGARDDASALSFAQDIAKGTAELVVAPGEPSSGRGPLVLVGAELAARYETTLLVMLEARTPRSAMRERSRELAAAAGLALDAPRPGVATELAAWLTRATENG